MKLFEYFFCRGMQITMKWPLFRRSKRQTEKTKLSTESLKNKNMTKKARAVIYHVSSILIVISMS